jgi:hypothetical protein
MDKEQYESTRADSPIAGTDRRDPRDGSANTGTDSSFPAGDTG